MMFRNKKILSLLLTLVMMFTICLPAFAATSDPNMTFVDYSQSTLKLAPGQSVTLMAGPATAVSYIFSGFDTEADARALTWKSSNEAIAVVQGGGSGVTNDGKIYGSATVTVPASATIGSCTVEVSRNNPASSLNFTIIVDSAATSNVQNIGVYLPDFVADLTAGNINHSIQKFTTPYDAMNALKIAGTINFTGSQSYISSITYGGVEMAEDWASGYGWNYRVYRQQGSQHLMVADSAYISMDSFKLQDNDVVVWLYDTYEGAKVHFKQNLADMYV